MFYDDVMKQIKNKDFAGEVVFSNISPPIPILKTYGDVCVKNIGESILVLFIDVLKASFIKFYYLKLVKYTSLLLMQFKYFKKLKV